MSRFRELPWGRARRGLWPVAICTAFGAMAFGMVPATAQPHPGGYRQINLVSDQPGKARLTDRNLVNAWGLAASPGTNSKPGTPLWVADNGSDRATLYQGAGAAAVSKVSLVGHVTGAAPTGQVFNANQSAFVVKDKMGNSGASVFLFDTENGTIDGWSPGVNPHGTGPSIVTEVASDKGARAIYKGLAIATTDAKPFLYATNFHSGRVEAYNGKFKHVQLPGGRFVDPRLPSGYGPFGIAEIMGKLYVTFAK